VQGKARLKRATKIEHKKKKKKTGKNGGVVVEPFGFVLLSDFGRGIGEKKNLPENRETKPKKSC